MVEGKALLPTVSLLEEEGNIRISCVRTAVMCILHLQHTHVR